MGLLQGGAIFGLGAAFGMFVARNRDFRRDWSKGAAHNCPLDKAKARELGKPKNNPADSATTQIPANLTLDQPKLQ